MVRAGLKIGQRTHWPVVGPIVRFTHGSSSPDYVEARWVEVEGVFDPNDKEAELLVAEADPAALFISDYIQRLKRHVVVVAADRTELTEVLNNTQGQKAIAASIGDVVMAGVLPQGLANLGMTEDRQRYTAGLREGTKNFQVGIGSLIEDQKKIVRPLDMVILDQHAVINELPAQLSHTRTRFF
jgi:hypothetical protein